MQVHYSRGGGEVLHACELVPLPRVWSTEDTYLCFVIALTYLMSRVLYKPIDHHTPRLQGQLT